MPKRSSQLAFVLPEPPGWGGRRRGAGRKRGVRPAVPHVAREAFTRLLPAHVTLRLRAGLPSLRDVRVVRRIERSFADACERRDFRVVQYSFQGNHAHLIVEARDQAALGRGMMAIGARLARAVNRVARRHGPVLAERYHHRLLPTPREVHRALRYVLLNARRHAAKAKAKAKTTTKAALAAPVVLDPASSGRWFDGWRRGAPVARDAVRPESGARRAVARARTWLLTTGWRRYGLIDPADVPG